MFLCKEAVEMGRVSVMMLDVCKVIGAYCAPLVVLLATSALGLQGESDWSRYIESRSSFMSYPKCDVSKKYCRQSVMQTATLVAVDRSASVDPPMRLPILQQRCPLTPLVVRPSIQHIVLRKENQIIDHRHLPQRKLDRIARNTAPVPLHRAVDDQLRNTQHAARKVQQDLPDAPPHRALVAVVRHHLRRVLNERDPQLHIADRIHSVQPAPVHPGLHRPLRHGRDQHDDNEHAHDAAECRPQNEARGAVAYGRREAPQRREQVLRGGEER